MVSFTTWTIQLFKIFMRFIKNYECNWWARIFSEHTIKLLLVIMAPYFNAYNQYSARDVLMWHINCLTLHDSISISIQTCFVIQAFHLFSINLYFINRIGDIKLMFFFHFIRKLSPLNWSNKCWSSFFGRIIVTGVITPKLNTKQKINRHKKLFPIDVLIFRFSA